MAENRYITTAVRDSLVAWLSESVELQETGAKVVARVRGSLISDINETIASLGLAVVVLPCRPTSVLTSVETPLIEELLVTVVVSESPVLNAGPEGEQVAELLLRLLHNRPLPIVGPGVMLFATPKPWSSDESDGLLLNTLTFRCTGLPARPL